MNLTELLETKGTVKGFELDKMVKQSLLSNNPQEHAIASDLYIALFSPDREQHPLKFVYYSIAYNKVKDAYVAYRNLNMSPRANLYFHAVNEDDSIGTIVRNKTSVKGSELIAYVKLAMNREFIPVNFADSEEEKLQDSYWNLSKQFAEYINQYFIDCDKPIAEDVYYTVVVKEYGTATLYRDLEKSPRISTNRRNG